MEEQKSGQQEVQTTQTSNSSAAAGSANKAGGSSHRKKRLKQCPRKFRNRKIVGIALLGIVTVVANRAANALSTTIDTYVGGGTKYVDTSNVKNGEDGHYYENAGIFSEDAKEAAYAVAKKVAEEGATLLKNDGILPLSKGSNVMPFGYAYLNPIYGQLSSGGSAKWVIDPVTPEQGLSEFTINTAAADLMNAATVEELTEAEGTSSAGDAGSVLGGDCKIYEYNPSIYDSLQSTADTTGIVFITRSGQEGQDQKYDAYSDGTPHYLALSENEKGAIQAAKNTCGKVVVILVSSAPMEMGELMEGDLEADAILWIGHPGERGFSTLSELLDGDVNPSGRTVDTWSYDFTKDPSYQAIGKNEYTNLTVTSGSFTDGGAFQQTYNEYMEGMYMGYRYYETADLMDDSFVYGELDGQGAFTTQGAVCYPFGYGLSYTTFDQELTDLQDDGYNITATVRVTNTGDVAGKDVAELYFSAPYTQLDEQYQIEKPAVELIAYDKTAELAPGESEELTLTFTWDDMTSYSYMHENTEGAAAGTKGCYMLEAGDYVISLRSDSHTVIDEDTLTQDETIWYDGSDAAHIRTTDKEAQTPMNSDGTVTIDENAPVTVAETTDADSTTGTKAPSVEEADKAAAQNTAQSSSDSKDNSEDHSAAGSTAASAQESTNAADSREGDFSYTAVVNEFQTSSDYMNEVSTILTRSDWSGTQPQGTDSKEIPDEFAKLLNTEVTFDPQTDAKLGNVEGSLVYSDTMPTSKADNGLLLSDMRGLSYDDPKWEQLLDEIDWDADRDEIIQNFSGDAYTTAGIDSIGLPSTVDEDGANGLKVNGMTDDGSGYDMTKSSSFGFAPLMAATWNKDLMKEVGQAFGTESLANGISGWYAPAINLHRSFFSGRVFEYMSEDPVLSGNVAAQMISGAADEGMYCYLKHFVLNETETGRASLVSTWADEQTMRELYLKAFEIAIKNAKTTINYYDEDGNLQQRTMRAATAVMAAQMGVGQVVGHCNYNLLTNVLRKEWGFEGMVITDYWVWNGDNMRDYAVRAGSDTYLCMNMPMMWTISDYDSATSRTAMRQAIKNLCYAVVNSNAMEGMAPGAQMKTTMSPWRKVLIVVDVLIAAWIALIIVRIVRRYKDAAAHPERYKTDPKALKKAAKAARK